MDGMGGAHWGAEGGIGSLISDVQPLAASPEKGWGGQKRISNAFLQTGGGKWREKKGKSRVWTFEKKGASGFAAGVLD